MFFAAKWCPPKNIKNICLQTIWRKFDAQLGENSIPNVTVFVFFCANFHENFKFSKTVENTSPDVRFRRFLQGFDPLAVPRRFKPICKIRMDSETGGQTTVSQDF